MHQFGLETIQTLGWAYQGERTHNSPLRQAHGIRCLLVCTELCSLSSGNATRCRVLAVLHIVVHDGGLNWLQGGKRIGFKYGTKKSYMGNVNVNVNLNAIARTGIRHKEMHKLLVG